MNGTKRNNLNRFARRPGTNINLLRALLSLVFVFAAELPLQAVDNAFDAGLKYVGGNPYGAPPFAAVSKDRQIAHGRPGAALLIVGRTM